MPSVVIDVNSAEDSRDVVHRAVQALAEGGPADVTILAPDAAVTIVASRLVSKSKNTPFDGWTLTGAVAATIVGGNVRFANAAVAGLDALRETTRNHR